MAYKWYFPETCANYECTAGVIRCPKAVCVPNLAHDRLQFVYGPCMAYCEKRADVPARRDSQKVQDIFPLSTIWVEMKIRC